MKLDLDLFLSYSITTNTGCMEWTRCYNTDGYPRAYINGQANGKVHRIVWELYNKESAHNQVVRHTCDNPKCINPKHLLIGSNKDNVQDRTDRDRLGISKTDRIAIKVLYEQGLYTQKQLALMFKVSNSTISYTLQREKVG